MSRPSPRRLQLLEALHMAFRQMSGGSVMFHQAVADRLGLHVTDHKCADLIMRNGSMTAGALAGLTGLTTGAITGVVDRLESVGLVRRAPDPNDRRRVMIEIVEHSKRKDEVHNLFSGIARATSELLERYSDEELAFILDFVERCNALSHAETIKLRQQASAAPAARSRARKGRKRVRHTVVK
jgi:DNA-binding MarR family transcriptional regulator